MSAAASRLNARQRLGVVLQEQRDADAALQAQRERERDLQLQHVLALKLSLDDQRRRTEAEAEAANKARALAEHRREAERTELEAKGMNAEGVFLQRREHRRQIKERERIKREDQEARHRIELRLQREEAERRDSDVREEERQRVKEALRMKVSRNLIEVAASSLSQKAERRRLHLLHAQQRQLEAAEQKENLLSTIPAADAEEEDEAHPHPPTPHERFLAWRQRHTAEAKAPELLFYQRRQHQAKLTSVLTQQHELHHDHPRAPIMGRMYHNAPVIASPTALHFKDYHPAHPLTLALTLTNTSFTFNSIQPLPSPHPSLHLHYHPPGRLSSGQSLTIQATWRHADESEASGILEFLTESGRMEVPWQVTSRKAVVRVEHSEVAMEVVVGEKGKDKLRLYNDGASDVKWELQATQIEGYWREEEESEEAKAGEGETGEAAAAAAASSAFPLQFPREGELKGYGHIDLPLAFHPQVASSLTVHCLLTLHPHTASSPPLILGCPSSFPLRFHLTSPAAPLHLMESTLSLHTLVAGKLYRSSLTLHNRSSHSHRFLVPIPPALRDSLAFTPAQGWVAAGGQAEIGVRLRIARADEERTMQAVTRLMAAQGSSGAAAQGSGMGWNTHDDGVGGVGAGRVIDLPMAIEVVGQTLPVAWRLRARVTSSLLILNPSTLVFPPTPLLTSAAVPVTITNQSTLLQRLYVHASPPLSTPTPFIALLPLRSLTFNVLYTPRAAVSGFGHLLITSKLGDEYRVPWEGRGVSGVGVEEGVVRMAAVVDGDEERAYVTVRNDGDREETIEALIPEAAQEGEDRVVDSFLRIEPRVLRLAPGERRRLQLTFAPRVRQVQDARERAEAETEAAPGLTLIKPSEAGKESGKEAVEAKAEGKKKAKKLSKEEQAKVDEEARLAEEARIAQEAEAARLREAEARRLEELRAYNSPEARAERERVLPSNPLAPNVAMDWADVDAGEPWSRHARHRLHLFVEPRALGATPQCLYALVYTTVVQPTLVVEPAVLDFGRVAVGSEETLQVKVANVGAEAQEVEIGPLPAPPSPFTCLTPVKAVQPGETATFSLRYHPLPAAITRPSSLPTYVRSATTRSPLQLIAQAFLPSFTVAPHPRLHVGHACPGCEVTRAVTVTNTSPAPLMVTARLEPRGVSVFPCSFTLSPWALTVPAGGSAEMGIVFKGSDEGQWHAAVTFNESHTVELSATCGAFPMSLHLDPAVAAGALTRPPWSVFDRLDDGTGVYEEEQAGVLPTARTARDKGEKGKDAKGGKAGKAAPAPASEPVDVKEVERVGVWGQVMRRGGVEEVRFEGGEEVEKVGWSVVGGVGDGAGGGSYEVTVAGVGAGVGMWEVEGPAGAVKGGEEAKGMWVFARRKFREWREGKGMEVEGRDLRGGEWVEAEGRCVFKAGAGKDGQGPVRVQTLLLKAWVD